MAGINLGNLGQMFNRQYNASRESINESEVIEGNTLDALLHLISNYKKHIVHGFTNSIEDHIRVYYTQHQGGPVKHFDIKNRNNINFDTFKIEEHGKQVIIFSDPRSALNELIRYITGFFNENTLISFKSSLKVIGSSRKGTPTASPMSSRPNSPRNSFGKRKSLNSLSKLKSDLKRLRSL
jgi:hypothetical protein